MCKVFKDYGVVADHGSKVLKLQKIAVDKETNTLALVSYKDGMSVGQKELTKEEAKTLMDLLIGYLDYKPEVKPKEEKKEESKNEVINDATIKVLTSLPATDGNYTTTLKVATKEQIEQALEIMRKGGRHGTRIKACENALNRLNKGKATVEDKATEKPKKEEEPKIVQFPTEDKKPKIIPLKTEGERTYGECVAKLKKEAEQFKDADSEYVITGLIELTKVDQDFRNNLMREDKTYGGFMEFMYKAAQDGYCVRYGNVGWLDRDTALGLAIDYFNHDSVKEKEIEEAKKAEQKAKDEANKKGAKKNGSDNSKKKGRTSA